jgi:hypothetical protein
MIISNIHQFLFQLSIAIVLLLTLPISALSSTPWWAKWAPVPSSADFAAIHAMESVEMIPWPHGSHQGGGRHNLSPAQLRAFGQRFFGDAAAHGVNATVLAEIIYTWTQPTYRQFNFPLTARPANDSVLGELITYLPLSQNPWVGEMFNLTATTPQQALAQITAQHSQIWANADIEIRMLQFALSQMEAEDYDDPTAPTVLYRGGARNSAWYCNQYSLDFDLSIDQCISQYFNPLSKLTVSAFWSTSPDASVTQHYRGSVLYYILPDPSTRTSWHVRNITQLNIDPSAQEHLYPAFSSFVVLNVTCVGMAPYGFWNVTLLEQGPGKASTPSMPSGIRPFQRCTA